MLDPIWCYKPTYIEEDNSITITFEINVSFLGLVNRDVLLEINRLFAESVAIMLLRSYGLYVMDSDRVNLSRLASLSHPSAMDSAKYSVTANKPKELSASEKTAIEFKEYIKAKGVK